MPNAQHFWRYHPPSQILIQAQRFLCHVSRERRNTDICSIDRSQSTLQARISSETEKKLSDHDKDSVIILNIISVCFS